HEILEKVFVPLARGAEQVRAPDEQVARIVVGSVRILARERETAVLQALHHVFPGILARSRRLAYELERVTRQLRRARQPAHSLRAHVVVDEAAGKLGLVSQRREDVLDLELLVAPLAAVKI